jgi:hypothetical protein
MKRFSGQFTLASNLSTETTTEGEGRLFLHVGPDGDCWTGKSIFAAKHLQPDYVQSIEIPRDMDAVTLVEYLEDQPTVAQEIYDTKKFPTELLERLRQYKEGNER